MFVGFCGESRVSLEKRRNSGREPLRRAQTREKAPRSRLSGPEAASASLSPPAASKKPRHAVFCRFRRAESRKNCFPALADDPTSAKSRVTWLPGGTTPLQAAFCRSGASESRLKPLFAASTGAEVAFGAPEAASCSVKRGSCSRLGNPGSVPSTGVNEAPPPAREMETGPVLPS